MLYAASPRGNNEGIGWLMRATAVNPEHALGSGARALAARRWDPSWDSAITYLDGEPLLSDGLQRALELLTCQRDSLVMRMREACSPWGKTESRDGGE
ncbi:hypothetical protein MMRN_p0500 (plasmid) [Mycobacterium marinum]|nr:hypothetical protein MMRN_p0500 [Mycobacterium marinum]